MAQSLHSQALRQEKWFDKNCYPFESHYATIDSQQMHYVDEGTGPVLLFVHGTPSWSFEWREQIKALSGEFRCVAPDHIGFGFSDKPADYDYSPEHLSLNLESFIDHLGLKDITLVVHDFGGPIGLGYAIRKPDNVKKVVMFNTWLWSVAEERDVQKADKILHSALGRFLYLRMNFSPKVLLKSSFYDKRKLPKAVHRHYTGVFPGASHRYGLLGIGYGLKGSSEWYDQNFRQIKKISEKPFLVLWGTKDKFIQPRFLESWRGILSNASFVELEAGHFPQEEQTEKVIASMTSFLDD